MSCQVWSSIDDSNKLFVCFILLEAEVHPAGVSCLWQQSIQANKLEIPWVFSQYLLILRGFLSQRNMYLLDTYLLSLNRLPSIKSKTAQWLPNSAAFIACCFTAFFSKGSILWISGKKGMEDSCHDLKRSSWLSIEICPYTPIRKATVFLIFSLKQNIWKNQQQHT